MATKVIIDSDGNVVTTTAGAPIAVETTAYPLVSTITEWNVTKRAGSCTPAETLPVPALDAEEEIRYIFTAATTGASFTAPSGFMLSDDDGFAGLSAGNTYSFTSLTVGSVYEISFAVLDSTKIALVCKEWKTA